MDPLQELIAVDQRQTLEFFVSGLKEVSEKQVRQDELLYNASVLAHFAQTSCYTESGDFPCPRDLLSVFHGFIFTSEFLESARSGENVFENGACQVLLFAGFFRDQMRRRHNIQWYCAIGSNLFLTASNLEQKDVRREFFKRMSFGFPFWADRHARLQRELRSQPYLLKLPNQGSVQ